MVQIISGGRKKRSKKLSVFVIISLMLTLLLLSSWIIVIVMSSPIITTRTFSSSLSTTTTTISATPVYGHFVQFVDRNDEEESRPIDAVYAIPSINTSSNTITIRGVALLLHACTHNALKFFSPNNDCNECIGLSEELRITRILLHDEGYAVLAVTAMDVKSGCWGQQADVRRIQVALQQFTETILQQKMEEKEQSKSLKIVAIGASSGGRFASVLAYQGLVHAALVMVSGLTNIQRMRPDIPIYVAPMPRDQATTKRAQHDVKELLLLDNHDAASSSVLLDDTTCNGMPVTPEYLHSRVPFLSLVNAQRIVKTLTTASSYLDEPTGFWLSDPTRSDWRNILKSKCSDCIVGQSLAPGKSPLAKAFHRCWAFHEYCSEVVPKALRFFEQTWERQEQHRQES